MCSGIFDYFQLSSVIFANLRLSLETFMYRSSTKHSLMWWRKNTLLTSEPRIIHHFFYLDLDTPPLFHRNLPLRVTIVNILISNVYPRTQSMNQIFWSKSTFPTPRMGIMIFEEAKNKILSFSAYIWPHSMHWIFWTKSTFTTHICLSFGQSVFAW